MGLELLLLMATRETPGPYSMWMRRRQRVSRSRSGPLRSLAWPGQGGFLRAQRKLVKAVTNPQGGSPTQKMGVPILILDDRLLRVGLLGMTLSKLSAAQDVGQTPRTQPQPAWHLITTNETSQVDRARPTQPSSHHGLRPGFKHGRRDVEGDLSAG